MKQSTGSWRNLKAIIAAPPVVDRHSDWQPRQMSLLLSLVGLVLLCATSAVANDSDDSELPSDNRSTSIFHEKVVAIDGGDSVTTHYRDARIEKIGGREMFVGERIIFDKEETEPQGGVATGIVQLLSWNRIHDLKIIPIEHFELREPSDTQHAGGAANEDRIGSKNGIDTNVAIERGLSWLADEQAEDGFWSFSGKESGDQDPGSATALVLLAFECNGHAHQSGKYAGHINKAVDWLLAEQADSGEFASRTMYGHANALRALSCVYRRTNDERLERPIRSAIGFAARMQELEYGGWSRDPYGGSNTILTGWLRIAFEAAEDAGFEVPKSSIWRACNFLRTMARDGGREYANSVKLPASKETTAIGLLCRQLSPGDEANARTWDGLQRLLHHHPFSADDLNYFYWYVATQALKRSNVAVRHDWMQSIRHQLPLLMRENGSWPNKSQSGNLAGPIYSTAMAVLTLNSCDTDMATGS